MFGLSGGLGCALVAVGKQLLLGPPMVRPLVAASSHWTSFWVGVAVDWPELSWLIVPTRPLPATQSGGPTRGGPELQVAALCVWVTAAPLVAFATAACVLF